MWPFICLDNVLIRSANNITVILQQFLKTPICRANTPWGKCKHWCMWSKISGTCIFWSVILLIIHLSICWHSSTLLTRVQRLPGVKHVNHILINWKNLRNQMYLLTQALAHWLINLYQCHWYPGYFHSGYLDYRGAFQTVFDLYCCVTSWT